jgi:hypothetical protein
MQMEWVDGSILVIEHNLYSLTVRDYEWVDVPIDSRVGIRRPSGSYRVQSRNLLPYVCLVIEASSRQY